MVSTITSTLRYAQHNDKLLSEKAYILNYPTPAGQPKSNFKIDFFPGIEIRNLRTADLQYGENGIKLATLSKCMPKEDFEDEAKVEAHYLPEVHGCIRESLGAQEVYIFDYMIRRREPAFPFQSKTQDSAPQPALSAHIDYTSDEINFRLQKYFKHQADEFGKRRFQIVNVWKPLSGPLRDYPMAYCDARTMDSTKDLLVVDEVFPTVANEVYQVLYSAEHRWYYIPDQLDNEVSIFCGFDSQNHQKMAVPHCSFDLGEHSSGEPRESIEVRAFVFY